MALSKKKGIEGSFRKTKSGKIEYRVAYKDELNIRRVKSFTCDTKGECLEKADEFMYALERMSNGIDIDATIPQIIRRKVESDYRKNYTGIQGYDRNLSTIAIIEKSMIGKAPIANLKPAHVEQFLESITSYSNNVIGKIYTMLRTSFRIAYDEGIIKRNFMDGRDLRCPRSSKRDKKVRGLTEEEQKKFVKALKEHKVPYGRNSYKLQLLIELYSGLRMGEINALRPDSIDFEKGFIHVDRTISRGLGSKEFIKDNPKTTAGVRDVPISNVLVPILKESLAEMKDNPEGIIFYDYVKDSIITTNQVNCFYKRICDKAGIEYNGQHSLRHTFATRCIEAEIPAIVLKKWLGHTDIHVTLDTYSDVFDRMNSGAIEKFENLIGDVMAECENE